MGCDPRMAGDVTNDESIGGHAPELPADLNAALCGCVEARHVTM
jgi:hypothetical protein